MLPAGAATAAPSSDARLIELGMRLDTIADKEAFAVAKLRPLWDEHASRMRDWHLANPQCHNDVEAYQRISAEIGLTELADRLGLDECQHMAGPLSEQIMALPATTLAGVAVKARLARYAANDYWDSADEDADWDKICVRKLVDAVIQLAGASI
jgi:hypothetical protein